MIVGWRVRLITSLDVRCCEQVRGRLSRWATAVRIFVATGPPPPCCRTRCARSVARQVCCTFWPSLWLQTRCACVSPVAPYRLFDLGKGLARETNVADAPSDERTLTG